MPTLRNLIILVGISHRLMASLQTFESNQFCQFKILSVVEKHSLGRRKTFSRSWGVAVFKNRISSYVLTI